jgi:hypothetical protein
LVEHETCDDDGGICRCLCGGLEKSKVNLQSGEA